VAIARQLIHTGKNGATFLRFRNAKDDDHGPRWSRWSRCDLETRSPARGRAHHFPRPPPPAVGACTGL
jgi:hypothetical protein